MVVCNSAGDGYTLYVKAFGLKIVSGFKRGSKMTTINVDYVFPVISGKKITKLLRYDS